MNDLSQIIYSGTIIVDNHFVSDDIMPGTTGFQDWPELIEVKSTDAVEKNT